MTAAQPTRLPKTLVIGSTGHAHVTCIQWLDVEKVNLQDFDVVVVNCRSLTDAFLQSAKDKFFESIRTGLTRLLISHGRIIVLGVEKKVVRSSDNTPYTAYSWCPVDISTRTEQGDTVSIVENDFPRLLSKLVKWDYWYYLPGGWVTYELKSHCGNVHQYDYNNEAVPFALNRYQRMLAGSFSFTVVERGNHKNTTRLGDIVVLPLIPELEEREAVNLVLEDLLSLPQATLPPKWVERVQMPRIPEVVSEINTRQSEIAEIQRQIAGLSAQKAKLEAVKRLLFESGHELEEVFADCLTQLGGKVSPARYSQEEFVLAFDGNTFLVECKGVTKSISLTHVRQLTDYMLQYEEEEGVRGKGVLLGNAWKDLEIADRGKRDTPIFPDNVATRSASLGIALVSSTDFFDAFCRFLDGQVDGAIILSAIASNVGIIDFRSAMKRS